MNDYVKKLDIYSGFFSYSQSTPISHSMEFKIFTKITCAKKYTLKSTYQKN